MKKSQKSKFKQRSLRDMFTRSSINDNEEGNGNIAEKIARNISVLVDVNVELKIENGNSCAVTFLYVNVSDASTSNTESTCTTTEPVTKCTSQTLPLPHTSTDHIPNISVTTTTTVTTAIRNINDDGKVF